MFEAFFVFRFLFEAFFVFRFLFEDESEDYAFVDLRSLGAFPPQTPPLLYI